MVVVALLAITGYAQTEQPKTVRDFFNLLPSKYFEILCCGAGPGTDRLTAHTRYLETFLRVEDTANGYLEGGCDGGQSCITMALFKKPGGTYVVGIQTAGTMSEHNYFLEYRGGKWHDVSSKVVPQFSRDKAYDLPRYGTTVEVFSTRIVERISPDQVIRDRGAKLYDLVWKNGRFEIKSEKQ